MLVFGNAEDPLEEVEKGQPQVPPSGQSEHEVATDKLTTFHYCAKLLWCIVGLQSAYLTWGVLQVSVTSTGWAVVHVSANKLLQTGFGEFS